MIAKEYLKSLTDPEKVEEDITAEIPVTENGVGLFQITSSTVMKRHVLGSI